MTNRFIKEWHLEARGIATLETDKSLEQLAKMGTPPKEAQYKIGSLRLTYSTVKGVNVDEVPRSKFKDKDSGNRKV